MILSLLLPALVFVLAAWQNHRDLYKQAELRIQRTIRTLDEHAVKIFETHTLVIAQVNERLRSVNWNKPSDRAELHTMLESLQNDFDHVATITVTDAEGQLRASGHASADPKLSFADRDWFKALKASDSKLPYVSGVSIGRQSGKRVFNIARRVTSKDGNFQGVIAVSVDRNYFERFYRAVEPQPENLVILVRSDGEILAREPESQTTSLPREATFYRSLKLPRNTVFHSTSTLDGVARLLAYRKVGPYPIYLGLGLSIARLDATWHHNLLIYAVLATLAAAALVAMATLVSRQIVRERIAVQRWQMTAVKLRAEAAERERVEAHLRQSQKMEAVGQLTSGIAHDFNNMLGAVIASMDLLRLRLKRQNAWDEGIQRHVENALEGAWRAASLTQRLLAFSRKQVLSPAAVDINALVNGMMDLIRRTISENVTIDFALGENVWFTHADPNQLENVVLNLVVNARDAMGQGGKLTVSTQNRVVAASALQGGTTADLAPGEYVMLAVSDTGSGMTPEVLARAFDPFFTTKAVGKGTGLGLSQVQGFVEQSRGYVKVSSNLGEGTTVEVLLPRLVQTPLKLAMLAGRSGEAEEPAAMPEEAADAQVPLQAANSRETVLVVEDDPQVRLVSCEAFRELGFTVLEASGAKSALEILAREHGVSLLFTDVVMPETNGPQLAEEVRHSRPDIKVLFTTGYAHETLVQEARMDPSADLITKPFTLEALSAKVARVLSRSEVVWW